MLCGDLKGRESKKGGICIYIYVYVQLNHLAVHLRSPAEGNGNPLQDSCLGNSMDRSLEGYSPWGCKESDSTEQLIFLFIFAETNTMLLISYASV